LAVLVATGLALLPRRLSTEGSGVTKVPSIRAVPDPDDDEDDWRG